MAPCFALLCAGALRVEVRRARLAGAVCAALLLAGYAYADWRLESSGNLFAHNPHHRISEFVAKDPSDLIVFHEEWDYGQTYFPLVHTFGMELRQYRPVEGGQLRVVRIRNRDADAPVELSELKASRFLVLRGRWLTQEDARRELQGKAVPMEPGRVTNALLKQPGWRRVAWEHLPAVWLGRIDVFER
jgi:hypothetical protein